MANRERRRAVLSTYRRICCSTRSKQTGRVSSCAEGYEGGEAEADLRNL